MWNLLISRYNQINYLILMLLWILWLSITWQQAAKVWPKPINKVCQVNCNLYLKLKVCSAASLGMFSIRTQPHSLRCYIEDFTQNPHLVHQSIKFYQITFICLTKCIHFEYTNTNKPLNMLHAQSRTHTYNMDNLFSTKKSNINTFLLHTLYILMTFITRSQCRTAGHTVFS